MEKCVRGHLRQKLLHPVLSKSTFEMSRAPTSLWLCVGAAEPKKKRSRHSEESWEGNFVGFQLDHVLELNESE